MAKIYTIISGKGGAGKTTTAINLGAALNKFKEDVVILDANLTTPNVSLHFGSPVVPVTLNHVLQGKAKIEEAIYEHNSGIKIIPSSISIKDLKNIKIKKLRQISEKLRKFSDYILIDSAAGLGQEAKTAIKSADEVILVANPNILSVTDALKTAKLAEHYNKRIRGAIITRTTGRKTDMTLKSIKEMLEVPILGIVPEDNAVPESLKKRNSVLHTKPRSKAARAYKNIAAKLLGKEKMPESLFERILSSLGLR